MKKVGKILIGIVIGVYIVVASFLTICLLNYNDYNITVLGNKSLLVIKDEELKPNFDKGNLVIVTKNNNEEIKVGDEIFFYNNYQNKVTVNVAKVINTTRVTDSETTFTIEGKLDISSQYVIGKVETSKIYENLGTYLGILESKWGFLFIIILPILLLFIWQIYAIIIEVKRPIDE